ncbi:hypothetical protein JCM5296_002462 [Sporobolomyces johnsonii]
MTSSPSISSPEASPFPSPTSPSPSSVSTSPISFPRSPTSPTASPSPQAPLERSFSPSSPVLEQAPFNPRHALMRSRRVSLPANVVQSRHYSMVGTSASGASTAQKRMSAASVASVGSFESVPEEGEHEDHDPSATGSGSERASPRPRIPSHRTTPSPPPVSRPANTTRYSLPESGYPSFSSVLGPPLRPMVRSTSPLRPEEERTAEVDRSNDERKKRAERRLRVAEELRDTEKGYVQVLEEIDAHYYQPLIQALPAADPLSRRSSARHSISPSTRSSSTNFSPRASIYAPASVFTPRTRTTTPDSSFSPSPSSANTSPATASTAPSTPPTPDATVEPVLTRREINEVFSNFTDVLNLSHVILLTLNEAVPARPSQPLSISPSTSMSPLASAAARGEGQPHSAPEPSAPGGIPGSLETELSSSAGTIESSGPDTPAEGDSPPPAPLLARRTRTTSTRSARERRPPPAPPLRLGKVLLPILPFLKQYSLFVANFSGSLARLSALEQGSSKWKAFLEESKQVGQGGKIGLGGMLLNVVQRVPRYKLLLADMLKYTEEDHPDLRDLRTAFALVDGVATHLESQIQVHTNDLAILDLQRSFTNLDFALLSPGRRLLHSGVLRKLNRSGTEQVRVFFLFNDLLLHASGGEQGGAGWGVGLGISGVMLGETAGTAPGGGGGGQGQQYRLHRRFELEDVIVVGTDGISDGGPKYGFEVLSPEQSFAVYADSLETKLAWLDAIRDAKAALMSDRRTLQRASIDDSVSTPANTDRRVSLPSLSASPPLEHNLAIPTRQVSLPPQLRFLPPTPSDEVDRPPFECDVVTETPSLLNDDAASIRSADLCLPSTATTSTPPSPTRPAFPSTPSAPPPVRPRTLARSRRWSEMHPSAAVQALASALVPRAEDLSSAQVEYKVIEAYHAPVWVPDSKADRCMRCGELFGVWRRRHHCRLCGGVVCWACSTKYFIIPGSLLASSSSPSATQQQQEDRLARSCDTCYTAVFDSPAPSSRFLASTASPFSSSTLQPCVDKNATLHRLSRVLTPTSRDLPLWDTEDAQLAAPKTVDASREHGALKRSRRITAMGELRGLLDR